MRRSISPRPIVLVIECAAVTRPDGAAASRHTLRDALARQGFDSEVAESIGEALSKAGARRPDLVLLDIATTPRDGVKALRTLRADPGTAALPVIALVPLAADAHVDALLELRADDFVAQPVAERDLAARVRAQIGLRRSMKTRTENGGALDPEARARFEALERAVTAERATQAELRHTKEFLESLIASSVDAIVAADLKGQVLLFNPGAERIYGFRAEEIVGRVSAETLYPSGLAREVMRRLRSTKFGGVGKLEQMRAEIVDVNGERVPIALSAALIYEQGEPVASFGIFTDLRERIRIEERLAQAQRKLEMSEKQAIIAELAGTAAHELNQPLTSVMGYAEMLRRKLDRDSPHYRAADIILREAERMAEVVRKIGKITKYETRPYVGHTQILDLGLSTGEDRAAQAVVETNGEEEGRS